jgi:HK97 family phage major capsid protein
MPSFAEVREELAAKREQLHKIFEEAGPDLDLSKVTLLDGDTHYKAGEIKRRNDELEALGIEFDRLHNLWLINQNNALKVRALTEPVPNVPLPNGNGHAAGLNGSGGYGYGYGYGQPAAKSLRHFLLEHKEYKAFRQANRGTVEIELPYLDFKTLVTLSDISPQADRRALVAMAVEERTTTDLMLQGETMSNSVEYYEETTVTNAAAETAEGVSKPESAEGFTLRTEPVRKIPTWIPATKEALDDVPFLESQLRGRMASNVRRREELQVLVGDGVAPNLDGIINRTGIQTQAKGADPTPDTVYKAMQLVRGSAGSGFAEPTAFVVHPGDWTDIKLLRTTDGIYIWGNPSDEGPDRIWGLPVRQTTNITSGTGLVGAFRPYAEVLRREGITVTLSTEHSTYFIDNKVAILAESRLALAVYRPSAFCTCTGI